MLRNTLFGCYTAISDLNIIIKINETGKTRDFKQNFLPELEILHNVSIGINVILFRVDDFVPITKYCTHETIKKSLAERERLEEKIRNAASNGLPEAGKGVIFRGQTVNWSK